MRDSQPQTIYLKDYQAPNYLIDKTELLFDIDDAHTTVTATLHMRRNRDSESVTAPLVLDGVELELVSLKIDANSLPQGRYEVQVEQLIINDVPDKFVLETVVKIKPQQNTSLEGLYVSNGMYCTQCEAEGFRKITYYLDRPDVMSSFTTTVIGDKKKYPVLLSNGNDIESGNSDNGKHWVKWEDPFKKPAYLFALVAGDLVHHQDNFTTMSGRDITLRIFVEERNFDKCEHAITSLKKSMAWDEEVYGREYDLDIFMIVAVDHFNMGAMENKGLNVFNSSCVLANPETSTDAAFQRIESIVGHEYFHNWSGNRVTCRDWFQLSLKEGFTVFRDQEFSADMGSRAVKRIEDVAMLRTAQFAEDAGPMAHPIRPASYMEINNFYTLTIYEKGAEVVRMIHTLLGAQGFRKGSDLYFERHDGQAVTTDDFVKAMEDANSIDLSQFKLWYSQAGTPELAISGEFDESKKTYTLTVNQSCPATPGQKDKEAHYLPLTVGLLNQQGNDMPLQLCGEAVTGSNKVLIVDRLEQQFIFENINEQPVPSLLRGFSSPVKVQFDYSRDQLMFLMANDSDGFNRWNAGQRLAVDIIQELVLDCLSNKPLVLDQRLINAYRSVLNSALEESGLDKAMVANIISLPSEAYLSGLADIVEVDAIHQAREFVRKTLATELKNEFEQLYNVNQTNDVFDVSAESIAQRSLKNSCLSYLMELGSQSACDLVTSQFSQATNMTDKSIALSLLVNSSFDDAAESALNEFYQKWKNDPLVVDQWLSIQAGSRKSDSLTKVKQLLSHECFDIKNPNKVRAVIGAFCMRNAVNFHQVSGEGYVFLADQILKLNELNPQIAARLLTPLTRWKKYPEARSVLMQEQLKRIKAEPTLSKDVYEIVSKSL